MHNQPYLKLRRDDRDVILVIPEVGPALLSCRTMVVMRIATNSNRIRPSPIITISITEGAEETPSVAGVVVRFVPIGLDVVNEPLSLAHTNECPIKNIHNLSILSIRIFFFHRPDDHFPAFLDYQSREWLYANIQAILV